MKKILVAVVASLSLFACASNGSDSKTPTEEVEVGVGLDMRTVEVRGAPLTCIVYASGYKGGVSCNWEQYNQIKDAEQP